ncbi:hypothetical protein BAY59_27335 [Prauserella coralliicola]|nr:hypothetical protein BAY59_27335 [Prauserella coralliicola]
MAFETEWDGDVTLVRPTTGERAKQQVDALFGVTGVTTPSKHLSLMVTSLKPGDKTIAHYHLGHESALYGIRGSVYFFWGRELESVVEVGVGDFLYIPPFCPHVSYNRSRKEEAAFVTTRTDAHEQERVVVLPKLDDDRCLPRVTYID